VVPYLALIETAAPAIGAEVAQSLTVPLNEKVAGVLGVGDGDVAVALSLPPHATAATRNTDVPNRVSSLPIAMHTGAARKPSGPRSRHSAEYLLGRDNGSSELSSSSIGGRRSWQFSAL